MIIHPCPNVESHAEGLIPSVKRAAFSSYGAKEVFWQVACDCGYAGPRANDRENAIYLHNAIAPPAWKKIEDGEPSIGTPVDIRVAIVSKGTYIALGCLRAEDGYTMDFLGMQFRMHEDGDQKVTHFRPYTPVRGPKVKPEIPEWMKKP
jgi:hypothetical protein